MARSSSVRRFHTHHTHTTHTTHNTHTTHSVCVCHTPHTPHTDRAADSAPPPHLTLAVTHRALLRPIKPREIKCLLKRFPNSLRALDHRRTLPTTLDDYTAVNAAGQRSQTFGGRGRRCRALPTRGVSRGRRTQIN